jgi:large subunit ribosomal protein L10
MAKTKDQKVAMMDSYKEKLSKTNGVIVIDHKGLTAAEVSDFKQAVKAIGGSYNVVKNTLFNIALDKAGLPKLDIIKSGAHAVLFLGSDVSETAKLLQKFMKDTKDKIQLRTGMYEGQVLTVAQITELAEMPTKEQSISMILGLLDQPMTGVVNVLEDSVRSIAVIINKAFQE